MKNYLIGIAVITYMVAALSILIFGDYLIDHTYHFITAHKETGYNIFHWCGAVVVFIAIPLAFFKKSRNSAGLIVKLYSNVFGFVLWILSFITVYEIWGKTGIYIGVIFFGLGVIPLAIIASLIQTMWSVVGLLFLFIGLLIVMRLISYYLIHNSDVLTKYRFYGRLPEWLRWILFIPLSIVSVLLMVTSSPLTKDEFHYINSFAIITFTIIAVNKLAPRYKNALVIVSLIARFCFVFWAIYYLLAHDSNMTPLLWHELYRESAGMIIGICFFYFIVKDDAKIV